MGQVISLLFVTQGFFYLFFSPYRPPLFSFSAVSSILHPLSCLWVIQNNCSAPYQAFGCYLHSQRVPNKIEKKRFATAHPDVLVRPQCQSKCGVSHTVGTNQWPRRCVCGLPLLSTLLSFPLSRQTAHRSPFAPKGWMSRQWFISSSCLFSSLLTFHLIPRPTILPSSIAPLNPEFYVSKPFFRSQKEFDGWKEISLGRRQTLGQKLKVDLSGYIWII